MKCRGKRTQKDQSTVRFPPFVLLLSGKNDSVYYSTKYTSNRTLLHCATECLTHFSACKMRSSAVSVNSTWWVSDFRTFHVAGPRNDNRERRRRLLEKSAAVRRKTDDRGGHRINNQNIKLTLWTKGINDLCMCSQSVFIIHPSHSFCRNLMEIIYTDGKTGVTASRIPSAGT